MEWLTSPARLQLKQLFETFEMEKPFTVKDHLEFRILQMRNSGLLRTRHRRVTLPAEWECLEEYRDRTGSWEVKYLADLPLLLALHPELVQMSAGVWKQLFRQVEFRFSGSTCLIEGEIDESVHTQKQR